MNSITKKWQEMANERLMLMQKLSAQHAETAKLKEKLEAVYDAGVWGIEYVAMANYAYRELEAKQKLREAAK